jgi:hypothetical protein
MQRIHLLDLSLHPALDALRCQQHPDTWKAILGWDISCALLGIVIHAALLRFVIRGAPLHAPAAVFVAMLSVLQLVCLVAPRSRDWYTRHRTSVNLSLRSLRLAMMSKRYYAILKLGPATTGMLVAHESLTQRTSALLALAFTLLIEPFLSLLHAVFHLLPLKIHVVVTIIRMALDVILVVPIVGCLLMQPEMVNLAQQACYWLHMVVTLRAPGSLALLPDVCGTDTRAWFMPATLLILFGAVIPFMITYGFELQTKLHWLRITYPETARELPSTAVIGSLMLMQLQAGLLISFCLAQVIATNSPWNSASMCASWWS